MSLASIETSRLPLSTASDPILVTMRAAPAAGISRSDDHEVPSFRNPPPQLP
jgi:hypothetical protein